MLAFVNVGKAQTPPRPSEWSSVVGEVPTVDNTSSVSADINDRLTVMRALGFRFGTNRDAAGLIVALVAARTHHGVIDIVQLYGEQDADATRISCHEPDILFPRAVFWRTTGSANNVIDALLSLAEPTPARRTRPKALDAPNRPVPAHAHAHSTTATSVP